MRRLRKVIQMLIMFRHHSLLQSAATARAFSTLAASTVDVPLQL